MSKATGLGDALYVSGNDLSGDINSVGSVAGPMKTIDVTAINVSAHERLGGLRDGHIGFTSYFNAARAHPVLSALPTADALVTYCRGTTLGAPAACLVGKQINYDGKRTHSGEFTLDVEAQANGYGLEWGVQLTAGVQTDTVGTTGTGVDQTASSSFGWQAYLHVMAFSGTSVTVKIQDSADNVTFADLTGAAFTAATAVGWQRIASASSTATAREYVRIVSSGTFTSASYAVVFVKNLTATAF